MLLEVMNHRLRGRFWKAALRVGVSTIGAVREIWIDVDSTVKTVFGEQEGAAKGYNPEKKGALSYHPLIAFCCSTKEILQAWYRTGNAYTSNGIVEFMKQLLAHMPDRVYLVFHGDFGFFAGELLAFLESFGHGYLIKVKLRNPAFSGNLSQFAGGMGCENVVAMGNQAVAIEVAGSRCNMKQKNPHQVW